MNAAQTKFYRLVDTIRTRTFLHEATDCFVSYADFCTVNSLAVFLLADAPLEQLSTLELAEYLAKRIAEDERKIRENDK